MTRAYEIAIVMNPELTDAEIERLGHSIKALISKQSGEVTNENVWGRKPTAYNIAGHSEGFYVFYDVSLEPNAVFPIDQSLKLTEGVLRHLITIKEMETERE